MFRLDFPLASSSFHILIPHHRNTLYTIVPTYTYVQLCRVSGSDDTQPQDRAVSRFLQRLYSYYGEHVVTQNRELSIFPHPPCFKYFFLKKIYFP